jgi:hypothetical protein
MSAAPTSTDQHAEEDVPFYKTVKRVSQLRAIRDRTSLGGQLIVLRGQSFIDVNIDDGVRTDQFCEASDAVIQFFGMYETFPFSR